MSWTPLSARWDQVPYVLAGPVLRRVEPESVTVWLAMKDILPPPGEVVWLVVYDAMPDPRWPDHPWPDHIVLEGVRRPQRLGPGCHVVAVTARTSERHPEPLQPGRIYYYNLMFGDTRTHLLVHGVFAENFTLPGEGRSLFGYGVDTALPSFSLPPDDPAKLRIIHGSCRRGHGDDRDALEGLDALLQESAADPDRRPHHLLLTGDQVYADNVAETLLYEIVQANSTLFGAQEMIPGPNVTADNLHAGSRDEVVKNYAGLKGVLHPFKKSHSLALTEYLSLYLYYWSDVLWPARGNWVDQATARGGAVIDQVPGPDSFWKRIGLISDPARDYDEDIKRLEYLRDALPAVRRALANVPTYMTFDDHDVTDDWSINYKWTRGVLDSPFGARLLRNGLTAYAICQGWGNRPEDFEEGQPGHALLGAAQTYIATGGADLEAEATIRSVVGPAEPQQQPDQTYKLEPPDLASALRWNWLVDFPSHRLIGLDGRTRCGYPDGGEGFLSIIAPSDLVQQIPVDNPKPITFVISGAPVIGYGIMEAVQAAAAKVLRPILGDAEEWSFHQAGQQSLLARLAHGGPAGTTQGGQPGHRSRVIVLSGDVHFGYNARLQYWAERPYGHASPSPVDMVLAQLVCSPFKNERPATDDWHRHGVSAFEGPSIDRFSPSPRFIAEAAGWANDGGAAVQVGTRAHPDGAPHVPVSISGTHQVLFSSPDTDYAIQALIVPPDYVLRTNWEVDPRFYTLDEPGEVPIDELEELRADLELDSSNDPAVAADLTFLQNEIEKRYQRITGASIIGRNQIGEITLHWETESPRQSPTPCGTETCGSRKRPRPG